MARSDLLINLVKASTHGDKGLLRKTVETMIAEERQKQHHILADRLSECLKSNGSNGPSALSITDDKVQSLIFELVPQRALNDLLLSRPTRLACDELIEEHQRRDLLHSYNLEPRHRVLLVGPPGNGKTSLAEAIANALALPLIVVRYEGVIGSYLGETALRLRRLFDYVRSRYCVLFFDEFDSVGKERGDVHETGEIKRVVSSLLLQVDDLPGHVLVVAATNHPELLDRAVWRRFQLRLHLPAPTSADLEEWFRQFEARLGFPLGYSAEHLAAELSGFSFGEVEEFGADILRRRVLELPDGEVREIINSRLELWKARYSPSAVL